MITNEILNEKYRVQRRLSASCKNIHDYFEKSHKSAVSLLQRRGIQLKYTRLPNKTGPVSHCTAVGRTSL